MAKIEKIGYNIICKYCLERVCLWMSVQSGGREHLRRSLGTTYERTIQTFQKARFS